MPKKAKKKRDYNNFKYKPSVFKTNQLYLIQSMVEVAQEYLLNHFYFGGFLTKPLKALELQLRFHLGYVKNLFFHHFFYI